MSNEYPEITCDEVECAVLGGVIYCQGVRVGWITTTSTLRPKAIKVRAPKPNKGPIPRQKWLQ